MTRDTCPPPEQQRARDLRVVEPRDDEVRRHRRVEAGEVVARPPERLHEVWPRDEG